MGIAVVAGCGSAPAPAVAGPELPASCHEGPQGAEAERCAGGILDAMLLAMWRHYPDAALESYVSGVGQRVATAADAGDVQFTFRVLDDPTVNAFALPGGYVYVTRGLLAQLGSEAELAAVLGHEVGHIAAGHTDGLFDRMPRPEIGRGEMMLGFEHERDEERQADQLAVRYLAEAGYDPQAVARMMLALDAAEEEASLADEPSWPDRHPPLPVRLALVSRAADARSGGTVGAERYLRHLDGLVLGDDPRSGHIDGRRFIVAEAGFSFELPDGWSFREPEEDGPYTVRAKADSPDGDFMLAVMRLGGDLVTHLTLAAVRERPTRQIIRAGLQVEEGALAESGESPIRLDAAPGVLAPIGVIAGVDGSQWALVVRPQGPASGDGVYASIAASLRRVPPDAVVPSRLRLRRLSERTTLDALAAAGCGPADRVARLNQLEIAATLAPGRLLKCAAR